MKSFKDYVSIPSVLYHATFKKYLKGILKNGLKTNVKCRNYDWCEKAVYLASTPGLAESFAETTEADIPQEEFDNIIILEINTLYLDKTLIDKDPYANLEDEQPETSWIYRKDIPPEAIKSYKPILDWLQQK